MNVIRKIPLNMEWFSEWIADLQQCACTVSIFQAEYEGNTVYWQLMTDPLCQGVIKDVQIYCCTGCELLVLTDNNDLVEFQQKVENMKIVYNCHKPGN
jgi:hypothetical protein